MHIMETIYGMKRQFSWYPLGLDLERSDEGNGALTALPLMSAATLERFYYTENNPFLQRADLNRYQTSGTSSKRRKTIFYSKSDEEAYLRIKLDIFRRILDGHKYRTAMADMGTGHAEATAVEVFRELGMEVQSLSFQLPVEQHLERLASFRPEVLYTMPSILDRILLASVDPAVMGFAMLFWLGKLLRQAG